MTGTKTGAAARAAIGGLWRADSLRGRLTRGAVWSLASAAIAQGSTLAVSVMVARLLGQEEYGKYGIVQSTVGMLAVFAGLGLGATATKYVAEYRTAYPERAGRIVALSTAVSAGAGALLAVALIVAAPLLAARTLNAPELTAELRIASLLLVLGGVSGAQTGVLAGLEAFRAVAQVQVVRGLVTLPATWFAVRLLKLEGAIWALAGAAAAACLAGAALVRRECMARGIQARWGSCREERGVLWTFSTPAFLGGAVVGPVLWAANTMLVNQPDGYREMGIFNAASQWRNAIGFVPGVLGQFALPILANLHGERDGRRYKAALKWNLLAATAVAAAAAAPVALGAPWIMRLYGAEFERGWPVLVLMAGVGVLTCVNWVVGTAILSAGSVWVGLGFNLMWAAALLAGCYFLIPPGLATGLAGSLAGAYLVHTLWQAGYLRKLMAREEEAGRQP